MDDPSDEYDEGSDAADAFALLGEETRVDILRGLADAQAGFRPDPIPFSELHDSVDVRDSAHFNYHLKQLVGEFVEKDDGYQLSYAGKKVVRAIRAGVYTGDTELDPASVEGTCPWCGESELVSAAGEEWIRIRCSACGDVLTSNSFPPGGLQDRDREAVLEVFDRLVRHRVSFAADRICPECTGPMAVHVSETIPDPWNFEALPAFQCRRCAFWVVPSFGMLLLEHPRVVEFYADHGIDLRERPYWDLPVCVSDRYTTIQSRDPWRVELAVEKGNETLRARIDDGVEVDDVVVEPTE
jgi:sirohydrochlorin ferrochelatase